MSLMEQFANPETMQSLSIGDKLAGAGITTVMGMGITFVVLILLWGCIAFMTKITYRPKKGSARKMGHRQPYTKVEIQSIEA